jgi:UDP-N-acetylmuramyl pentapeptide phosphotransferase/UDP-N-acetylglucosamine-1-phosphate transferase
VPRIGGMGVLAGVALTVVAGLVPLSMSLVLAFVLAAMSFMDDLRPVPPLVRLSAHVAAAGVLAWYVLSPMGALELTLLVLAVGWVTNLYNFMDGSDGLAGGMSVIGFTTYACAATLAGRPEIALLGAALAGASAGFLAFNFHPARIFLGDVGSIPLGFLAAAVGLTGWMRDAWPLWFPLLVFGPFIGDATLTLLKRAIRGERVWRAHREHYYQRMVRMGLGHRGTALFAYAAMVVCSAAALLGRDQPPVVQFTAFVAAGVFLAAAALWIDILWARHRRREEAPT